MNTNTVHKGPSWKKIKMRFLILLLLTPGFWWVLLQPKALVKRWISVPRAVSTNITKLIHPSADPYQTTLIDFRWGGIATHRNSLSSKSIYNPANVLVKDFFDYIQFLTPGLYFMTGDGSNFSPPGLEPVSVLLFPFWILGLIYLIKKHRYLPFVSSLILILIAYLAGIKEMSLLLPVLIIYVYISNLGLELIKPGWVRNLIIFGLFLYGGFLIDTCIWLR